jgi:hypothetical protein
MPAANASLPLPFLLALFVLALTVAAMVKAGR